MKLGGINNERMPTAHFDSSGHSRDHSSYQFMMESADHWEMKIEFNPDSRGKSNWASLHVEGAREKMSPAVLLQLEPARLASPSYIRNVNRKWTGWKWTAVGLGSHGRPIARMISRNCRKKLRAHHSFGEKVRFGPRPSSIACIRARSNAHRVLG